LRPFILLTNDDGVDAPGILALREAAQRLWDTVIVAPDREQSAQSHALTLNRPLRVNKVADGILSVDGTPSDCMMLALRGSPDYALHNPGCPRGILERKPDLAISGINHGANLGDDVIYSGTVAGAAEAAILGLPSIAVSMVEPARTDLAWAADITVKIAGAVLRNPLPRGVFLNVNVPPDWTGGRFEITCQGTRQYRDVITKKIDPRGRPYYWIGGRTENIPGADSSDVAAIERGNISITPLHLDMTAMHVLKDMESWSFE
jgi:5'-nucleotidase